MPTFVFFPTVLLRALLALSLLLGGFYATAQAVESEGVRDIAQELDQARTELKQIQAALADSKIPFTDQQLVDFRNRLNQVQTKAAGIDTTITPLHQAAQARLAELGLPEDEATETQDVKKQRSALNEEISTLSGQLKIARLIAVEAEQAISEVAAQRRQQFQDVVSQRGLSPFAPSLWRQLQEKLPDDRLAVQKSWQKIKEAFAPVAWQHKLWLGVGALVWALGGIAIWFRFIRFLVNKSQPTRLRRSLLAIGLIGLYVAIPTGVLLILLSVLMYAEGLTPELLVFVRQFIAVVALAAFIAGLGRALLSPHKPTWRLPSLPNEVAQALQWLPLTLGGLIIVLWTLQQLTHVISSSLSTVMLTNGLLALGLNAVVGIAVWRAQRYYRKEGGLDLGSVWLTGLHRVALRLVSLAVLCSVIALLVGYTALSNLIIQEVIWLGVVVLTTYLLYCLLSDVAQAVLNNVRQDAAQSQLNQAQWRWRSQAVLLFSGGAKLGLLLVAATLFSLPFGEDPVIWLQRRLAFLSQGFTFGEVTLKPAAFLYGMVVLVVGGLAVHSLQAWLANQYLPYTRLDPSMRSSAARLVSYVGYVAAVVVALSAAGIGFDRMAWIVSALSVGIGFGLQAVVQNFVSGLLLLAERPIKVGDWVSLGADVEGNVRRINARATEIERFDRSTVIVPNSEFITKVVRNVTLSEPLGRGQITVVMPVNVDAQQVRACLLRAAQSNDQVLEDPAPFVTVDGFEQNGGIAFSLFFYLPSPRLVSAQRSEVFFAVLELFAQARLALHHTQRMEVIGPASSGVEAVAAVPPSAADASSVCKTS